ncbi:MAG: response regulator transcription factor [Kofleriaceae bacterium]|nr:response regulator transcription factor [Kofleriaceae bacterium]
MTARILIVEDDEAIATGLALNLKLAGRTTAIARDGDEALRLAEAEDFALVLLDINLPAKNGLEVLSTMRATDNLVPVIVVSARDGEFDKVAALRLGADDYVTKPFALAELLARIDAVLRRTGHITTTPITTTHGNTLSFADVSVDLAQRLVTRKTEEVKLTHLEFELLVFFLRHPSQVFSRAQLFSLVWGQSAGSVRTVDNFVGQLRKRFESNAEQPRHFITVRGSGYRFDP